MFDNAARKLERLEHFAGLEVSTNVYNLVLGATVWYGLVVNALMVYFWGGKFNGMNPLVFLIGYFASCFVGCMITYRSDNPAISFIGYNFVVIPIGIVLTVCLPEYPAWSIALAAALTAVVTLVMTVWATIAPQFFAGLGNTLLLCLTIGVVAEIVAYLLGYNGTAFDKAFVVIFSLYIGYDWTKAQQYPKNLDNAVDSALDIYLDIINLFLRILSLLGTGKSKK